MGLIVLVKGMVEKFVVGIVLLNLVVIGCYILLLNVMNSFGMIECGVGNEF